MLNIDANNPAAITAFCPMWTADEIAPIEWVECPETGVRVAIARILRRLATAIEPSAPAVHLALAGRYS